MSKQLPTSCRTERHPAKGSTEARQRTMARTAKQPKEEAVPIEIDTATVDKELDPMDAWSATERAIIRNMEDYPMSGRDVVLVVVSELEAYLLNLVDVEGTIRFLVEKALDREGRRKSLFQVGQDCSQIDEMQ